jgi:uncharacterized protein (TIGR03663 family)
LEKQVPTGSTKQRARKRAAQTKQASVVRDGAASNMTSSDRGASAWADDDGHIISERVWLWASVAVVVAAALLRLYALELKPLHHDEGVNGFFLTRLVREGVYQYDPANYHGPTLYYFALVPAALLEKFLKTGMTTFAIRLVPVLFGLGTVCLALSLRRHIGALGALAAAALIALSPGAVYNSRYFIHESLFVFFTLGIVVAALRYYETTEVAYLFLAVISAALMFATKETAFISLGVLVLAMCVAWAIARFGRRPHAARHDAAVAGRPTAQLARLGGAKHVALLLVASVALFVLVNVLFYSSFFRYAKGVDGAIETFKIWTQTGTSDFHKKPWETYIQWLWQEEAPIFALAILGATWAVFERAKNGRAIFFAAWAFGILAAYSLVPYKTPWLALNFIVPMAIAGGYGVERWARWATDERKVFGGGELKKVMPLVVAVSVAALFCLSLYQTVVLNFQQYDNDQYIYVYAHTKREFLQLMSEVERLAARAGTGKETKIAVASPDYWPLPWYLRDYKHTGFFGQINAFTEPIVIGNQSQDAQLSTTLAGRYRRVGEYPLRPGVSLVLYAQSDLAAQR